LFPSEAWLRKILQEFRPIKKSKKHFEIGTYMANRLRIWLGGGVPDPYLSFNYIILVLLSNNFKIRNQQFAANNTVNLLGMSSIVPHLAETERRK
jgi:hypothetical protein